MKKELDLFVGIELPAMKERAKREGDKELTTYRWIWALGGGAALATGTSGALSGESARYALTGAAATVALLGYALYAIRSGALEECRAFLEEGGDELAAWGRSRLRSPEKLVDPDDWRAYVEKVHALRSHPSCLKLRR